jgi:N-acetyl-1-D-myo-inositol-2-amino-2-deoxy-alpha-D-glucopyranoside deacetylase
MTADRRVLFVHAHPDDETISNGATMAKYVAEGAHVTLVTCTAGEEGEVVVEDLAHVASAHEDRLADVRQVELAEAMKQLGVTDHRFLGGFGRFRDSGMMGTPQNKAENSFWQADLLEAAAELVAVIREVRPQVIVSYDEFGGYGHPDHIKAHRVAMYGYLLAQAAGFRPDLGQPWTISKVYWNANPRSLFLEGMKKLQSMELPFDMPPMNAEEFQFLCDDDLVTTEIDGRAFVDQKIAALREHRTQLSVDTGFFAAMQLMKDDAYGREFYRLLGAAPSGGALESDLFAGI